MTEQTFSPKEKQIGLIMCCSAVWHTFHNTLQINTSVLSESWL